MQSGELSPRPGAPRRRPGPDDPLRIAYLTYRGKPHVGGQGVYTRHLTKALSDLGHHVEVLSGQGVKLSSKAANLLQVVLDNGRFVALPEIAAQFTALVNTQGGVSDALVESAFAMDAAQLAEVVATLERRFGRRLQASVQVRPELIGGIRVTVGDEVLDTSVKARLEQMKVALTA